MNLENKRKAKGIIESMRGKGGRIVGLAEGNTIFFLLNYMTYMTLVSALLLTVWTSLYGILRSPEV